ncbi:MAG: BatA domain-containing protein [Gemmatimonadaceae bacterium]
MMFLAPGYFLASLAVAMAIVALHFIVTRQPRAGILPTARFVPELPATATARATRPSDLLLMLLRVLLVLAVGAGLAQPVVKPSRGEDARVILVDASRSVADIDALRDSVRSVYRPQDALVVFDSSARILAGDGGDSIDVLSSSARRGNLSAALIVAMRAGSSLRESADSLELLIVSPFAGEEAGPALDSVRSLWPAGARLVVAGRGEPRPEPAGALSLQRAEIREAAPADPLSVTADLASAAGGAAIVRRGLSDADSAREGALVDWPASARPRGASPRAVADTIGGVTADFTTVVAGFERRWIYASDSIAGGEIIARWVDGEPAAVEWKNGDSCLRSVSVPVPSAGDLAIRGDFVSLFAILAAPCLGDREAVPMTVSLLATLRGNGGLVPREAFRPRGDVRSWLAPWLIALGLAAAVIELFVRRRTAPATRESTRDNVRMDSAA